MLPRRVSAAFQSWRSNPKVAPLEPLLDPPVLRGTAFPPHRPTAPALISGLFGVHHHLEATPTRHISGPVPPQFPHTCTGTFLTTNVIPRFGVPVVLPGRVTPYLETAHFTPLVPLIFLKAFPPRALVLTRPWRELPKRFRYRSRSSRVPVHSASQRS